MKVHAFLLSCIIIAGSCSKISVKESASPESLTGSTVASQVYGGEPLIGYADVSGTTTGGAGGTVDTVTTLAQLETAAESSGAKVIYVSGTISSSADPSPIIFVTSNKSIIGLEGSLVSGVCFSMYGSSVSNVIIRNMRMCNTLRNTIIDIKEGSHHIWVDHNELWTDRDHGWDYYDGLCDVTNASSYVTISWNKFHDNHIPVLIGSHDARTSDIGYLKTTLHHNYFYNCTERQPSVRFGTVHTFNNYHNGGGANSYSVGSTMDAVVRTDNNYFENISTPIRTDYNSAPGYVSGASTNYFAPSCGSNVITTTASTWTPSEYSYSSYVTSTSQAKTDAMAGAGPIYTTSSPTNVYQAENGTLAGSAVVESSNTGFNGTGYVNPTTTGSSVQINNVDGAGGGTKTIVIRYSLSAASARAGQLVVNGGSPITITAQPTGAWTTWTTLSVNVSLNNNSSNTIKIQTNGQDWGLIDQIEIASPDTYQAENGTLAGSAVVESAFSGFNGTGYVNPASTGSSVQINNVDGNGGGTKTITIRYSLSAASARAGQLVINGGSPVTITAQPTGAWDTWTTLDVNVTLNNNSSNTIKIQTNGQDWGLIDQVLVP